MDRKTCNYKCEVCDLEFRTIGAVRTCPRCHNTIADSPYLAESKYLAETVAKIGYQEKDVYIPRKQK